MSPTVRAGLVPLLLAAGACRADVLIDNIAEPIRRPANVSNDFWPAQSFITPGGGPLTLTGVSMRVGVLLGDPVIRAELRADSAAGPGALIANLGLGGVDTGATRATALVVPSGIDLAPATTYWLVLGVDGPGGLDWSYAAGNAASGSGSYGNYGFSNTQGASWVLQGMEDPYMTRIEVSAVPEPAAALLAALGIAVLGLHARRRYAGEGARL